MNVWTKICGITRSVDALAAVEAGADAIGVNFCKQSPRLCALGTAADIAREVRGNVDVYGVFAGAAPEDVATCVEKTGVGGVQLHGGEDEDFIRRLRALLGSRLLVIRVVPVAERAAVAEALAAAGDHRVLLDSPRGGGSGTTFDRAIVAGLDLSRAIAAGGLTPGNVAEAIVRLKPYGVDVATGVEVAPGVKDHAKIREFIENAKRSAA